MNISIHCFSCRYECLEELLRGIGEHHGGLDSFTTGYKYFGLNKTPEGGIVCREWVPAAQAVYLRGDFSKYTAHVWHTCNIEYITVLTVKSLSHKRKK